jgi:hypothetical protein
VNSRRDGVHELDAEAILRVLVEHGVEFVLIGGLAVAVHGYPRGTKDVDVVPQDGRENAERLFAALTAIGARQLEVGDFRPEEMPVPFGVDGLAMGGNWALRTERGRVDVMGRVPGVGGYDELTDDSLLVDIREVGVVRVAGYRDVVTMKTTAGRPEDAIDLQRLREARGET